MSGPKKNRGRGYDNTGRSLGSARHIRFYHWMMRSPAWRSLDAKARCALIELYALYNGENNGDLFLSVRDLSEHIGCSPATAARAFVALEDRGFIRTHRKGGFNIKDKTRQATSWILTEFEFANSLPTKEFMRYEMPNPNKKN